MLRIYVKGLEIKSKNSNFTFTFEVVPKIVGRFGIVASILYGFGNEILHVKPKFKGLWTLGGLLIMLFEIVLGGWLLLYS